MKHLIDYTVYVIRKIDYTIVYVGMTSDPDRREKEHLKKPGKFLEPYYTFHKILNNMTREDAVELERQLVQENANTVSNIDYQLN